MNTTKISKNKIDAVATANGNRDQIRRALEARVTALKTNPVEPEIASAVALRENVADGVFEIMESQNVSQADLARRLGKSRAHVCRILGGGANLTLDTLAALSAALGCELKVQFSTTAAKQNGKSKSRQSQKMPSVKTRSVATSHPVTSHA